MFLFVCLDSCPFGCCGWSSHGNGMSSAPQPLPIPTDEVLPPDNLSASLQLTLPGGPGWAYLCSGGTVVMVFNPQS
ncbi:hypothetical protein BDR04DRAFT_823279 [Suillus decipiens]|nr:hypothetical protein BDR04DRAFT_823279 [Suillus decipiens]